MKKIRNTPPPWQVISKFSMGLSSREALSADMRREVSHNG